MTDITLSSHRRASGWRALARHGMGLWPMTAAMVAVAAAMALLWLPGDATLGAPVRLEWWVLAIAFAVTESAIIHIPVQRDAHTISMSEIPLILGLVFAAPPALLAGRLVGGALALVAYRRQPLTKVAFNTALFALETVTALAVYRAVLGAASPAGPAGWIAALAAVGVAIVVAAALVNLAIGLSRNQRPLGETMRAFAAGLLISIGTGFIGTLCSLIVWYDVRAAVVLAGAGAMFFLLIRVYGSLSRRHDDLRAVYAFTSATSASSQVDDVLAVSLREATRLLRAEHAELVLGGAEGVGAQRVALHDEDSVRVAPAGAELVAAATELASLPPRSRVLGDAAGRALRPAGGEARRRCALVAPLDLVDGRRGAIVVSGRVGPDRTFELGDLELLDALASHVGLTLGRAEMVDRLREEIAAKQEIIRSKDQLIAAVSHELRTPLTGILGFAELLVENSGRGDEQRASMLESIASDALDMSNLVEDLLTAARAHIGALTVSPGELRLREMAQAVVDHLGTLPSTVTITGPPGRAVGDESRVRQILRNLVVNADRYGGDTVRIEIAELADRSTVRVCDNGEGIPVLKREVVFDPYERAHRTPTQPGSLGLGLSISRTLARLMDGELTYAYADGWSVFELSLPAPAGPQGPPAAAPAARPPTAHRDARSGRRR